MKVNLSFLKRSILVLGMIIMSYFANAQYINLSGKVTDAQTRSPLANAEVYLANTTIRAHTDSSGRYIIQNLPTGTYELIAWCAGYETKPMELVAAVKEQTLNISLNTRIIQLSEVTITDVSERKRNLERFKDEFLGHTTRAEECIILNEDILNLKYSSKTQILTATTDDFLEVLNEYLGYKLRFLIKDLSVNYKDLVYHYTGSMIFEELPGTKKQQKQRKKNRNEVYEGSFRHFISSATQGKLKKDGFIVKRITTTPNPNRPPDSLIKYKMNTQFAYKPNNKKNSDSLGKWSDFNKMPKIIQKLSKEEVTESGFVKSGKVAHTYDVQFRDTLYVIYKNKYVESTSLWRNTNPKMLQRFPEAGNKQIAAINILKTPNPITFNERGIQVSEGLFFYDGTWGDARLSKQLPLDFIPDKN